MKKDLFFHRLVHKMDVVSALPPQELGGVTPFYKKFVPLCKYSPWKLGAAVSFLTTVILYLILGHLLVRIASILQLGF